jgi:hypothetical protein
MNIIDKLLMNMMFEPTPSQEELELWASKTMQYQWRQKQKKYKRNKKLNDKLNIR